MIRLVRGVFFSTLTRAKWEVDASSDGERNGLIAVVDSKLIM